MALVAGHESFQVGCKDRPAFRSARKASCVHRDAEAALFCQPQASSPQTLNMTDRLVTKLRFKPPSNRPGGWYANLRY